MPPRLQSWCRLGNLRQQSDKLRNEQPSPPFVPCSHPQPGANTNRQKSEHFRRGPRFSLRYCAIDLGKRRAPGRRRIRSNLEYPATDTAAQGMGGAGDLKPIGRPGRAYSIIDFNA
jgi:hypothetical protein